MRILVINPNTTARMTEEIGQAARMVASPGTEIVALNPGNGPASIQGPEDGEAALPGLFSLFEREMAQPGLYDAAVIACFDDTGLWELKQRSPVPVLGIGEAAFHMALLSGQRFSVVTTLAVSVPVIEQNIDRYGFSARCARVRASGVPVLDIEEEGSASGDRIADEIGEAIKTDGCDTVVLGCAGMAHLAAAMTAKYGIPVIDGVVSAVSLCEALHSAMSPQTNG